MNFSANTPTIAIEDFDNEIIIVNLEKGNYYSLRHTAFDVWKLLVSGHTLQQSITSLADHYDLDPRSISSSVEDFLSQLTEENLLVPAHEPEKPDAAYIFTQETFQQPSLEVFTDMQELLLLDPIHEVKPQEQGWPFKK